MPGDDSLSESDDSYFDIYGHKRGKKHVRSENYHYDENPDLKSDSEADSSASVSGLNSGNEEPDEKSSFELSETTSTRSPSPVRYVEDYSNLSDFLAYQNMHNQGSAVETAREENYVEVVNNNLEVHPEPQSDTESNTQSESQQPQSESQQPQSESQQPQSESQQPQSDSQQPQSDSQQSISSVEVPNLRRSERIAKRKAQQMSNANDTSDVEVTGSSPPNKQRKTKRNTTQQSTAASQSTGAAQSTATSQRTSATQSTAASQSTGSRQPSAASQRTGSRQPSAASQRTGSRQPSAASQRTGSRQPSAASQRTGSRQPSAASQRTGAIQPSAASQHTGAIQPTTGSQRTTTTKPTPEVIVLSDDESPDENMIDDDDPVNYRVTVKILWKSVSIKTFHLRRFQKFTSVFDHLMRAEEVPFERILLQIRGNNISRDDTPESLDLQVYDFIEGGIVNNVVSTSARSSLPKKIIHDGSLTVKFQDKNNTICNFRMLKHDMLRECMMRYAEEIEVPFQNLKFLYDEEVVKPEDTPYSLQMEDGDIIDVVY